MDNEKNKNCHFLLIIFFAILAFLIGVFLIIVGYFLNKDIPGNIWAFLALNLGALVSMGSAYTLLSELILKKDFAKQLRASIDQNLEQTELNKSILKLGLHSVRNFEKSDLWQRIEKSDSVVMVAMRNNSFFKTYCNDLLNKIRNDNAKLTFILLDPDSSVIPSLVKKFSDLDESGLRETIRATINIFIRDNIYKKLPADKRNNLIVRKFDEMPVYSAYIFDNEELWYIPFHYRHDYKPIPMFILKGREIIKKSQLFKDLLELQSDSLSTEEKFE